MQQVVLALVMMVGVSACRTAGGVSAVKEAAAAKHAGPPPLALDCTLSMPNGESDEERVDLFHFADLDSPTAPVYWTPYGASDEADKTATYKVTDHQALDCSGCYQITAIHRGTEPLYQMTTLRLTVERLPHSPNSTLTSEYMLVPGGPDRFVPLSEEKGQCTPVQSAAASPEEAPDDTP